MEGRVKYTIFVIGDSQVGKTSFAFQVFSNSLIFRVSTTDRASEYHVYSQGEVIRILEIRGYAYLLENVIEFDERQAFVVFCYAINDPHSFRHVAHIWIPFFKLFVSETMPMILIGNKRDLRFNAQVIHYLAESGLQPVSTEQGTELFHCYNTFCSFIETTSSHVFQPFEFIEVIHYS